MAKKSKVLSKEEVENLYLKLKQGDPHAREKLIKSNLGLVITIAKKYERFKLEHNELVNTGVIGLIKGIDSFQFDKGSSLGNYLYICIENEVLMYIRKEVKRFEEISLNSVVYKDADRIETTLLDMLESDKEYDPVERYKEKELKRIVIEMIGALSSREQEIILLRYGFVTGDEMTHREIGELYGITRTPVTRSNARILKKLRKNNPLNELRYLL